ncbi:hypothetical protein MHU86_18123 [Fragilaria crotonensis]|nr:hypothetical protein MHU86_18123 [Fragilaria crotonensis]
MGPNEEKVADDLGQKLSTCMFSQYQFFVAGVGLGGAYAIHLKKGPAPMILAGLGGSLADLVYGYAIACQDEVRAYHRRPRET